MKLYAFWPYDLFPYTLGGEVEKITATAVTIKGYSAFKRTSRFVIVPHETGAPLRDHLDALRTEYLDAVAKLNASFEVRAEDLFKAAEVQMPKR